METNKGKSWDEFLLAVNKWFDPEFYEPYPVTASFGPFGWTRGTCLDQRQPNRNREPDNERLHQIEEVKHTVIVVKDHNVDGDHTDRTCSELHMASEIIDDEDIKGVGYDMEQACDHSAKGRPDGSN